MASQILHTYKSCKASEAKQITLAVMGSHSELCILTLDHHNKQRCTCGVQGMGYPPGKMMAARSTTSESMAIKSMPVLAVVSQLLPVHVEPRSQFAVLLVVASPFASHAAGRWRAPPLFTDAAGSAVVGLEHSTVKTIASC